MGTQLAYLLILKDIPASVLLFKVTFLISTGKGTLGARPGDQGTSLPCHRVLALGPYLALFLHFKVSNGQSMSSLLTVPGTQVVLARPDRIKMFCTTQKTSHLAPISKAEVGSTTALAPKGEGTGGKNCLSTARPAPHDPQQARILKQTTLASPGYRLLF